MKKIFTKTFGFVATIILFVGIAMSAYAQTFTKQVIASTGFFTAMTRDGAGNIYVIRSLDGTHSEVEKCLAGQTTFTAIFTGLIAGTNDETGGTMPWGLAVSSLGDVCITTNFSSSNTLNGAGGNLSNTGNIIKLASNNGFNGTSYTPTVIHTGRYYTGLAFDSSNNLYAIQMDAGFNNYTVTEYTSLAVNASGTQLFANLNDNVLDNYPQNIAVASNLDIYVTNAIRTIAGTTGNTATDGVDVRKYTKASSYGSFTQVSAGKFATALALDPSDNLYVSETDGSRFTNYRLNKYTNGAGSPTQIIALDEGAGMSPMGIAAVSSGNIYVLDGNNPGAVWRLYGAPGTPASSVSFSNIGTITATVSWTNGDGTNRAVFMANTTTGGPTPVNNTTYTANTVFGSGTQPTAGWSCIYNGTGTSVPVTGLTQGQTYRVKVFEYNGTTGSQNYLQSDGSNNPFNVTTLSPTTINSLNRVTGQFTNASSVNFSAVFGTAVTGVTASNFSLTTTGVSGASVGTPTTSDNITWTVPVNSGTGDGTIQLNLANATGLSKTISTSLPFAGQSYTIDKTAPTISIGAPSLSATTGGPVTYTVTYADANFNSSTLANGNITLNTTGTASGTPNVTGSGLTRTVTISGITGNGTLGISIAAGTASDLAGNTAPAAGPSTTFSVDNTAPTISIGAPSLSATTGGPVTYTVTYADANFNSSTLANGNITLNTTGTASGTPNVTGSGLTRTVTISGITGNGTLGISIAAGTASDIAGNTAPAAGPSTTFSVDNTAPTISIGAPSLSATTGGPVTYTVTYADANFNSSTLANGNITLNTTGTASGTPNVTGSGLTRTVTISGITGNGTLGISIAAGTASDIAGNTAPAAGPSTTFTVDNTAPTISIGAPSLSATTGGPVTYTVTYADANFNSSTLANGDITLNTTGTASGTPNVTGSGLTRTVTISGITGDGTLGISIAAGTASDIAGNTAPAAGPSTTFTVDNIAPAVVSIARSDGNPIHDNVLDFQAVFSEPVTGVDLSDFTLTTTGGITSGAISVSAINATTYNITVINVNGNGTARLDLNGSGTGITDAAGNAPAAFTGGEVYTVDQTAPTVSSINIAGTSPTNASSVDYTVTFSEAVTGVDATDFTVSKPSGSANGSITGITGSGTTYTVTVGSVSGNGTLRLDLNASGTAIVDGAANPVSGGFTTGQTYTIDTTVPTLTSGSYFSNNGYSSQYAKVGDNITLSIGYNEVLQSLVMTIGGNAVTVTPSNGNRNWTGVYTETSADIEGNVPWTLSATDLAGNVRNYANTDFGTVLIFDKTAPVPAIGAPTPAITGNGAGNPVTYTISYNDANFNFSTLSTSDITLNTTGTATGTIGLSGSSPNYTVTISNITGFGTLGISIGAGTGQDIPGNIAVASAPSTTFDVVSADATLSALTTDLRKVAPIFNPAVLTGYTTHIPYTATSTAVIATPVQSGASVQVQVNGGGYVAAPNGSASPALSLNPGDNTIDVLVTAPDLVSTKTYTITTTRAHSSFLSTLTYSPPSLKKTKVSGSNYVDYTATVDPAVTAVSVTPVAEDPTSVITVNGVTVASGATSSPITLVNGPNTINTVVTTIDGLSTRTYSIVVTKQANALLSSLTYNPGLTVHKATGTHDFDYTATVSNSSIKVLPVAVDPAASITVNGTPVASGTESGAIALALGQNNILTVVTAADGVTTKSYNMVVTRQANALLSMLSYSPPSLKKVKVAGSHFVDYTASVDYHVTEVLVTPTVEDPTSTVTVNGVPVTSGTASAPIALIVGNNTINTEVTAADGTTKNTYSIVVTRQVGTNLSSLTFNPGLTLHLVSGSHDVDYTAIANNSSITVTPTVEDPAATVTVNGTPVTSGTASGPIALTLGANTINTVVTASDGTTTKTYSTVVTRQPNALLATLAYGPASIKKVKVAGPDYVDYTATVANGVNSATVTPTVQDPTSTVKVNGTTVASGATSAPIALTEGNNTINTVVTAEDGTTTNTYSIVITRQPAPVVMAYKSIENSPIVVHQNVSPNGDGTSDVMQIDGITAYPDNKLQIMNRSGALVYETKGYDNATKAFDGHANNGKLQQAGTYFYSLEYKDGNETKHKTGFIVLKY